MDEQAYAVTTPWGWRDRLRWRLFPAQFCDLPEAPAHFEDVLVVKTHVGLSFLDRLRVLASGRLIVETKTVCENRVGAHITASTAFPVLTFNR